MGASRAGSDDGADRASSIAQLDSNVRSLEKLDFSPEEWADIDRVLKE